MRELQVPSSALHKARKGKVLLSYTEAADVLLGAVGTKPTTLLFPFVCLWMHSPVLYCGGVTLGDDCFYHLCGTHAPLVLDNLVLVGEHVKVFRSVPFHPLSGGCPRASRLAGALGHQTEQ